MAAETTSHEAVAADHGAHAPAGTTEVAAHGGGESGGGLPQFEFEHWGGQIVWLFLIFAVLYILLAKVFIPRLRKIQDTRAATIADAVTQARSVQAEAEAQAKDMLAAAQEEARRYEADAKAKAAAELASSQKAEDERLQAQMDEAEARIRGLRDQAMTNVRGIAGETAQAMVEKLTGQKVTAAEIDAALTARVQGAA